MLEGMSDDIEKQRGVLFSARKTGQIARESAEKLHDLVEQLTYYIEKELRDDEAAAAAETTTGEYPVTQAEEELCSAENTPQPSEVQTANTPGSLSFSQPSAKKGGRTKT